MATKKKKTETFMATRYTVITIPKSITINQHVVIHFFLSVNKKDRWVVGGKLYWIHHSVTDKPGLLGASNLKPVKFSTYDRAIKAIQRIAKSSRNAKLSLHGFELDEIPSGDGHND